MSDLGSNIGYVDEMYARFLSDPASVSEAWREFFADYQYYLSYTRSEVPSVLRGGANRAFHEGIGELISIANSQTPYLKQVGILPAD